MLGNDISLCLSSLRPYETYVPEEVQWQPGYFNLRVYYLPHLLLTGRALRSPDGEYIVQLCHPFSPVGEVYFLYSAATRVGS